MYRAALRSSGDSIEQQHTGEVRALHNQAMQALHQAREAERALAGEKERLATALARMTRASRSCGTSCWNREQASRAAAEEDRRIV